MIKPTARLKHCVCYQKSVEDKAKSDAIVSTQGQHQLLERCKKNLGKVGSDVLVSRVDGVNSKDIICQLWHDFYSKSLNSNGDTTYNSYVESTIKSVSKCKFNKLCYYELNDAMKNRLVIVLVQITYKVNTLNMLTCQFFVCYV